MNVGTVNSHTKACNYLDSSTGFKLIFSHIMFRGSSELVFLHAPLHTRTITEHPNCPWYTDILHEAKHLRRKLEQRWKKSRLTVNHQIYRDQCIVVNKLLKQTRIAYYSENITACAHDQKGIYKVARHLLGDSGSTSLPQTGSPSELNEMFSSFFINKIQNTRRDLQTDQTHGIDQDIDTSSVNTALTPQKMK